LSKGKFSQGKNKLTNLSVLLFLGQVPKGPLAQSAVIYFALFYFWVTVKLKIFADKNICGDNICGCKIPF
jgi:hypothetical protein